MNPPTFGLAIVAPGGSTPDNEAVERGIAHLQAQGVRIHNYYQHHQRFQRFGGTDDARLAQLHAAARDPDVQVVMALRGQYGISRLMERIDYRLLADSGKIFVGYSDVTALHMALYALHGAKSYAGPMFSSDFASETPDPYTAQQLWSCLRGPSHTVEGASQNNPVLDLEGTIWGGNLSMLMHMIGTPYFPIVDDGILFIEDVNEHPYRIERMLLQLEMAGVLARQQVIVIGHISAYRLAPSDNGYDFDVMLAYLRERLPVPIVTGLPFGHVATHATIPFGARARLVSETRRFVLTMSDYPTLQHA